MNKNPFEFSKPVENSGFYNRKENVEEAIAYIKSMQSFSIVGQRRFGKTSFLNYILSEEILAKYGINPKEIIVINLGLDSLHEITENAFIGAIVEEIEEQIQVEIESNNVFKKLEILVENLAMNDKKLIIALDEFEIIEPILESFSYWLRYIFQKKGIAAITASQIRIGELSLAGTPSPLFNIFCNLTLGLFSREETENMIQDMFQSGEKELKKDEISFLADLSGGNPFLIQVVGFHYYLKRLNKSEFKEMIIDQVKDIFTGYWKHLSEEEKEFILDIENSKNDGIAYKLRKKGFIMKEDGKWKIFSPLFEEFITAIPRSSQLPQIEEGDTGEEPLQKEEINGRLHNILNISIHNTLNILIGIIAGLVVNYVWEYIKREDRVSLIDFVFFFRDKKSIIIFFVSFLIVFIILKKFQGKRN